MKGAPMWVRAKPSMKLSNGTTIEFNVASRQSEIQGIGTIRVERHPQDTELVCIWITMLGNPEFPVEQIWLNHTEAHPDPSKADYLCELRYDES